MAIVQTEIYYNPAAFIAALSATSVANLPNRAGSATTIAGLSSGQLCTVGAQTYCCYDPTAGAAVWYLLGHPKNPNGGDRIQTISASTGTVQAGIDRVIVTYAGACTITLPSVLNGAPIGTRIVIQKASTNAGAITITPDSGSNINGGTTDANQTMVGLNNTASTTVSSASTNDIAAIFVRVSATQWRSTAA